MKILRRQLHRRYKDGTPDSHIEAAIKLALGMKDKIDEVIDIEVYRNIIDSPRHAQISLFISFKSLEDLQSYTEHPEHQSVIAFDKPYFESVSIVDYWDEV